MEELEQDSGNEGKHGWQEQHELEERNGLAGRQMSGNTMKHKVTKSLGKNSSVGLKFMYHWDDEAIQQ